MNGRYAAIRFKNGKRIPIGTYPSREDAARGVDKASF
jgi:hypothetical protein